MSFPPVSFVDTPSLSETCLKSENTYIQLVAEHTLTDVYSLFIMTNTETRLDAIDRRIDGLTNVIEQLVAVKQAEDKLWISSSNKRLLMWLGIVFGIVTKLIFR